MQHNAEFAPGWLRAQIRDSINRLKTDPSFSGEIESFCQTEEKVSNSSCFRSAEEDQVEGYGLSAGSDAQPSLEA